MSRTIEQKIYDRDTEVQRAYDMAYAKKINAESRIDDLIHELSILENHVLSYDAAMEKCVRRAKEQGYDESIF